MFEDQDDGSEQEVGGTDQDDVYTETEDHEALGFGQKLKNSITGVLIGFVLFIASFFILYKGETRVDRSKIVMGAAAIEPDSSAQAAEGQTVKFAGKALTPSPVADAERGADGRFLYLARLAEMYAWVEETETRTKTTRVAGRKREKTTTTTRYVKKWTSSPSDSSDFKKPQGHSNPSMGVKSHTWVAAGVTVGSLPVDLGSARVHAAAALPEPATRKPTTTLGPDAAKEDAPAASGPWFIGKGSPSSPEVGDIRLSYTGVKDGSEMFVCGKLDRGKVVPTFHKDVKFMIASTQTEPEVTAMLRSEHRMWMWIARIGGFVCMWLGMCLMVGPLTFLLNYIPVLGGLATGMLSLAFGIIALVLTLLTILLVRLFWVWVALAVIGVLYGVSRMLSERPRSQFQ